MKNIPKVLYLYWDRKNPLSWLQALTPVSFHKYNPDWKIELYVPRQNYEGQAQYIPDYIGPDYYPTVAKLPYVRVIEVDLREYSIDLGHHDILRSDILRYNLLYERGGVWSDFDVLWLRPMEYFKEIEYLGDTPVDEITSVVSLMKDTKGGHSIGIMIHSQYDEYARALVELTKEVKPPYGHEVFGSLMISKPYPTLESLSEFKGLVGVKHETYYPYDIHPPNPTFNNLYLANDLSYITKDTMCLHWYNGKELSKRYMNSGGTKIDCSMTTLLKQEGYI